MRTFAFLTAFFIGLPVFLPASDPTPIIGGRFDLRNASTGDRVTQESYQGRYRLVFFGFTHCPLTCPMGLRTIEQVLAKLGKRADQVQCLFITLDPGRDNAAVMTQYLKTYDPRITGLVGSEKSIHAAMKDFRLEAERVGSGGDYMMEHPSIIYLMGKRGEYLKTLCPAAATRAKSPMNCGSG